MSQNYANVSMNDQTIEQTAEEELEALEDAERRKTEMHRLFSQNLEISRSDDSEADSSVEHSTNLAGLNLSLFSTITEPTTIVPSAGPRKRSNKSKFTKMRKPLTPLKEESTPDYNMLELSVANQEEMSLLYQARVNECSKLNNENTVLRLKLEESSNELLKTKSDFEMKMANVLESLTATEKLLATRTLKITELESNYQNVQEQINFYQTENSMLKEQNQKILSQQVELENKLITLKNDYQCRLTASKTEKCEKCNDLEKDSQEKEQVIKTLEAKITNQFQQINELSHLKDQTIKENQVMHANSERTKEKIDLLNQEIKNLQGLLEEHKFNNNECGKCNEKSLNFNKQILKQKDIVSSLEAKLNVSQQAKNKALESYQKLETCMVNTAKEMAKLKKETRQKDKDLEHYRKLENHLLNTSKEPENLEKDEKCELENNLFDLQQHYAKLTKESVAANECIAKLNEQLVIYEQKYHDALQQRSIMTEELSLLKKEKGELLSFKTNYEEKLEEYDELKKKHKELKQSTDKHLQIRIKPIEAKYRQDIMYLNKELEGYKKAIIKLNKSLKDETRLERKITEATKMLRIKDVQIENLEKELDGKIKEIEKLNSYLKDETRQERKLTEVTNLLNMKDAQNAKLEKELDVYKDEIEKLKMDLESKKDSVVKLESKMAELNEKHTDVKIINSNLQKKLMDVNQRFLNSNSLVDEYNSKINIIVDREMKAQSQLKAATDQIAVLEWKNDDLKQKFVDAIKGWESDQGKIGLLQNKCDTLTFDVRNARKNTQSTVVKMEQHCEIYHIQTTKNADFLREKLAEKSLQVESLQQEIINLEKRQTEWKSKAIKLKLALSRVMKEKERIVSRNT